MTIRPIEPGDEAGILKVWGRTLVRDPVTEGRFRRMVLLDVNFDPEGCLVAEASRQVVGFALGMVRREPLEGVGLQPETGWITAFGVDPAFQRQGVGSQLLTGLLGFFEARGRRQVLVSPYTPHYFFPGVDLDAYPGGLHLLERAGFREVSRAVGMSRKLLDFVVPAEVEAAEARGAEAGIRVCFFEPDLLRPLLAFLERDFPGDWPRMVRERLEQGAEWDEILVAERAGEVIGFCHYDGERFGPFGVADRERGRRLGTLLFYRGVARMKAKGRRHLWLAWSGGAAQRFYERHGLTVDRTHVIMRREL
jgi:ribosomal protein S18 acetylase RimI-like enzyme